MILEGHDSETSSGSTLVRSFEPLDLECQVEDALDVAVIDSPTIRRVYAHWQGTAYAVWIWDQGSQKLHFAGRVRTYRCTPREYRYPGRTGIATLRLGIECRSIEEAQRLAQRLFRTEAGTVVLLDDIGVLRAWEKDSSGMHVTAIGPRPRPRVTYDD